MTSSSTEHMSKFSYFVLSHRRVCFTFSYFVSYVFSSSNVLQYVFKCSEKWKDTLSVTADTKQDGQANGDTFTQPNLIVLTTASLPLSTMTSLIFIKSVFSKQFQLHDFTWLLHLQHPCLNPWAPSWCLVRPGQMMVVCAPRSWERPFGLLEFVLETRVSGRSCSLSLEASASEVSLWTVCRVLEWPACGSFAGVALPTIQTWLFKTEFVFVSSMALALFGRLSKLSSLIYIYIF